MEFIKKNITLIVGISIPILMIVLIAISIYLPGLFIQPKYNFLYTNGDDYCYHNQYQYSVQNGKLVRSKMTCPESQTYSPQRNAKLYIYNIAKNKSREISFEEARNLNLDPNNLSPDGFKVTYGSRGGGFFPFFFYFDTDYNNLYLEGHNISKKLNLQLSGSYYHNFRFIGWIK